MFWNQTVGSTRRIQHILTVCEDILEVKARSQFPPPRAETILRPIEVEEYLDVAHDAI